MCWEGGGVRQSGEAVLEGGGGDALVRQGWSGHRVVHLSGEAGRPPCGESGALVRPSCA